MRMALEQVRIKAEQIMRDTYVYNTVKWNKNEGLFKRLNDKGETARIYIVRLSRLYPDADWWNMCISEFLSVRHID